MGPFPIIEAEFHMLTRKQRKFENFKWNENLFRPVTDLSESGMHAAWNKSITSSNMCGTYHWPQTWSLKNIKYGKWTLTEIYLMTSLLTSTGKAEKIVSSQKKINLHLAVSLRSCLWGCSLSGNQPCRKSPAPMPGTLGHLSGTKTVGQTSLLLSC